MIRNTAQDIWVGCCPALARDGKEGLRVHGMQSPLAPEPLGSGDYSSKRGRKRALCAQSETALLPLEGKIKSLALGTIPPAPCVLPSTEWSGLSQEDCVPQSTWPPPTVTSGESWTSIPHHTHSLTHTIGTPTSRLMSPSHFYPTPETCPLASGIHTHQQQSPPGHRPPSKGSFPFLL